MIRASSSTVIRRKPEQVFEFIADLPRNYRRWSPEVVDLEFYSPGPVKVGSRARQVRVDQGRRTETTFRVSALEPAQRMEFQGVSNPFRVEYRLQPDAGARTRLTFTFELTRVELFMKPFEKLIRMAVRQGAERTVHNLQQLVERETPPPADAPDPPAR